MITDEDITYQPATGLTYGRHCIGIEIVDVCGNRMPPKTWEFSVPQGSHIDNSSVEIRLDKEYRHQIATDQDNLNKFYQENWSKPTFDKYVQEAQTNVDEFLNEHFTMTSMQKDYLKSKAGMDKAKINNFINNIAGRTKSFAKSKMGGSPGMIAAQGSGKTCSAGQSWKCWKLDLSTVSFEYCYCS